MNGLKFVRLVENGQPLGGLDAEYQEGNVEARSVGYMNRDGTPTFGTLFFKGTSPDALLEATAAARHDLGAAAGDTFHILGRAVLGGHIA